MTNFLKIKNLKMGLGFAGGFAVYDYFADGHVDWIKTIITAILAVVIMAILRDCFNLQRSFKQVNSKSRRVLRTFSHRFMAKTLLTN